MGKRVVGVNDEGLRVGQYHHNAKLTDAEVECLRRMHGPGMGYKRLARIWEMSVSSVRYYVKGGRRDQVATDFKTVHVTD